ncbi:unnamed protein product [Colletotrichum noveboracense]|uniref:Uncharacterized protein n=1 Tax=Colletotrichum noveboracense TaxID=2664923 RepID=A0A9W4RTD7_9PEZI|nr:hypothetical protein K456DRAFT_1731233 [Colletotrichum gloeosporioides 23]CAI0647075.1 unnamed protein product [Colletotrichum noveboracense]
MPSYSNASAAITGSASGRSKTTAVTLEEYLASPPTVTENIARGKTTKDRKKVVQRGLEKWQKDWDTMGAAQDGK